MRLKIFHEIVHKLKTFTKKSAIVNNARFLCVIVNNALSEFADVR